MPNFEKHLCESCGRFVCNPCQRAPGDSIRKITLASVAEINRPTHRFRLAQVHRTLGFSRYEIRGELIEKLVHKAQAIEYFEADDAPHSLTEKDLNKALGVSVRAKYRPDSGDTFDFEDRWYDAMKGYKDVLPKQAIQKDKSLRYIYCDLYLRVTDPVKAAWIAEDVGFYPRREKKGR